MRLDHYLPNLHPRELYLRYIHRDATRDVIATIDQEAFLGLRKTARDRTQTLNNIKYFNLDGYIGEHVKRAMRLNLHINVGRQVLDIGTGFGYFPYVCEFFGNGAQAIDVSGHDLFDDVTNFLRVKKTHHFINAFEPLPTFDRKFDVINATQIAFVHIRGSGGKRWGDEEWGFFLDHLINDHLTEKGIISLEFNWDSHRNCWFPPEVRTLFKNYGARMFHNRVLITPNR